MLAQLLVARHFDNKPSIWPAAPTRIFLISPLQIRRTERRPLNHIIYMGTPYPYRTHTPYGAVIQQRLKFGFDPFVAVLLKIPEKSWGRGDTRQIKIHTRRALGEANRGHTN
jgi:hypothetical protein